MIRYINPKEYMNIHIGSLPPPHGGISTYLYRLSKTERDLVILNKNEFKGSFILVFFQIIKFATNKNAHFILHTSSIKYYLLIYLINALTHAKYSMVLHGEGFENIYNSSPSFLKPLLKKLLNGSLYIQVVGNHLLPFVKKLVNREIGNNLFVQNAFLPPPIEEKHAITNSYPAELMDFISTRRPLLLANAFSISFFNGVDLYGLDMCIELTKELKDTYPDVGFIFAIANPDVNRTYLDTCSELIAKYGINDNFFFLSTDEAIWPLFEKLDLMVRPTCSDGYGVSISEALYIDCPTVASNVCERAKGTVIFNNRDIEDFVFNVKNILNEKV
jgi:hypothetical protein